MKVTGNEEKCRKLREEGHVQIVSAEQKGYVQVHTNRRITENSNTNTNIQTDSLLEKISQPWIFIHDRLFHESSRKLRNRRVPNGTHGGVRGRLIK